MLSGTALADLARRTRGLAMRFDQVRRDLIDLDAPADCPMVAQRVREIEGDAATIAELETVMAALQRAEREERPASTARRPGLYARTLEAFARSSLSPGQPARATGARS